MARRCNKRIHAAAPARAERVGVEHHEQHAHAFPPPSASSIPACTSIGDQTGDGAEATEESSVLSAAKKLKQPQQQKPRNQHKQQTSEDEGYALDQPDSSSSSSPSDCVGSSSLLLPLTAAAAMFHRLSCRVELVAVTVEVLLLLLLLLRPQPIRSAGLASLILIALPATNMSSTGTVRCLTSADPGAPL